MKFGFSKLNLNRDIYILLIAVIIMHVASYLIIPVLPIILRNEKGINPTQIGTIIAVGSIAYQIGNVICGIISDRIGKRTTMVIGAIIQAFAFIGYSISNDYILLLIFSFTNGVGGGIHAPTLKAAISELTSSSTDIKTTAFSLRGIAANIGTSIGGLIILFFAVKGSSTIFIITAITYGILALFTLILLPKGCMGKQCPRIPPDSYKLILKNKAFLLFGLIVILSSGIYSLIEIVLPLKADEILDKSNAIGSIFTIMSVSVIFFQSLISKYILLKINPLLSIFISMLFFAVGLFLIGNSNTYLFLTVSAVVFTFGQMFMVPTTDSIVSKLASSELVGAYFGIANLLFGLGRAGGTFISGKLITKYGIDNLTPWVMFAVASISVGFLIILVIKLPLIKKNIK